MLSGHRVFLGLGISVNTSDFVRENTNFLEGISFLKRFAVFPIFNFSEGIPRELQCSK